MSNQLLATITHDTGFEKCWVSLVDVVSIYGALVGTPTVAPSISNITISGEALNATEQSVNGITHPANTLLSFLATTATGSNGSSAELTVTYETANVKGSQCFTVKKDVC